MAAAQKCLMSDGSMEKNTPHELFKPEQRMSEQLVGVAQPRVQEQISGGERVHGRSIASDKGGNC